MENDTLVEQVSETIQDTSAVNDMIDGVRNLATTPVSEWLPDLVKEYVVPFGIKLVAAIVVLLLGRWVIKLVKKGMTKMILRRDPDPSLASFVMSLVSALLTFFLIMAIVGILGINTSSLVALLASAGLAVGMALSGTLQNFAGGVMIMLFKPFKVDDFIAAQGYEGKVSGIQIFNTTILTPDNKTVILPNGALSTGPVTNFNKEADRRVDWSFSIAYGDDYDKAKAVLLRLCDADDRIKKESKPIVELLKMTDSSIDITVRVRVKPEDYWGVYFKMNELVYKTFPQEGLHFPFPQLDVHMMNS
jgi:small conductance mechanosensitive channel